MENYIPNIIKILQNYWKVFLIEGVSKTLLLSAITVTFGAILGIFICIAHMSSFKPLKWLAACVIEIIRGTPMLLQLYIAYFFLPQLFPRFNISDFWAITIAMIINSGCYVSEVFRSGIQAVDHGQTEAARSLGLSASQTMYKIVLPQAIKNILPALGNEFVTIIKETSLASTFFIGELMTSYLKVKGVTYLAMETLLITGVLYLVLNIVLTRLLVVFERKLKSND